MDKEKQKLFNQLNAKLNDINITNHDTASKIRNITQVRYQTKKQRINQRINKVRNHKNKIKSTMALRPSSQPTLEANIVLALILLNHKPQQYIYNLNSHDDALHAKYASDYSTLNVLTSLGLATIIKHRYIKNGVKCKAVITSTGRQFVKEFIPQYQSVYRIAKKQHTLGLKKDPKYIKFISFCCIILLFLFDFIMELTNMSVVAKPKFIAIFLVLLPIIGIIIIDSNMMSSGTNYRKNIMLYKAYSKKANKSNVLKFLKEHHLQEPDYQFNNDSSQIPLSQVIFQTANKEKKHYNKFFP